MAGRSEISTIERAIQLARSGSCHSVDDIRQQLTREGYDSVDNHLQGMTIKKQLTAALAARGVRPVGEGHDRDDG